MNKERSSLEVRAAKHAALADPARLRIVDLLTLGDLSPRELQDRLGMPSNLVSHHLGVLEREGIISRHRSEADKRRSYVRLEPVGLEELGPSAGAAARRVLFVCTANSARSQIAAELWRRTSSIPAVSAGTHPAETIASGAIATARRHGIELPDLAPQALGDIAAHTDLVITVCDSAHEELGTGALHWSIPDPVPAGTDVAFDAAFEEIARRIDGLVERVAPTAD